MDVNKPFNSIAKKMLNNIYNGDFNKKINAILSIIEKTHVDGVIHLCQWDAKQSIGGSNLLKKL